MRSRNLENLFGICIYDAQHSTLEAMASRVRPGVYFYSSLLVMSDADRQVASNILKFISEKSDQKLLAFAADLFGDIWAATDAGSIVKINTETLAVDETYADFEAWAGALLGDPNVEIGLKFSRAWQHNYGEIPEGHRLTGRIPFVMGGKYDLENVVSMPYTEVLAVRFDIGQQIFDLPDGARVMLNTTD